MKLFDGLHAFIWSSMSANNCNTYLVDGSARVLIDPGHLHLFEHVTAGLRKIGLGLSDIDLVLVTHGHPDHFEAAKLFKKESAALAMSAADWEMIEEIARYMGPAFDLEAYRPDFFLDKGDLQVRGLNLDVIPTPGHSKGSVSLYWPSQKALFSGDLLFRDGLGRTDLPGGNGEVLKESIRGLKTLDAEWLLPGHGEYISGKNEVAENFKRVEQNWFAYI